MPNWQELESQYYMFCARRFPVVLVKGEGTRVWDEDGKEYLDFLAGIATNCLGHAHPTIVNTVTEQAKTLIHVSNYFYTLPQIELAEALMQNSCMDKIFFGNSGTEANEGAVKLARKYGKLHLNGAYEVITAWNSFHGRTLAMVAATGKAVYQHPYRPLTPGFTIVDFNDIDAIKEATNPSTCAIMLEPIQGEGGVNIPDPNYFKEVRAWCDEKGILLIFDEVQTGLARTGTLWGYEQFGIEPDIMTLAKALGGGVPIGAVLSKEKCAVFEPGDHGSTFGGNPLACAVGRDVFRYILDNNITAHVREVGEHLMSELRQLQTKHPFITDVRGRGLLIATDFADDIAAQVVGASLDNGLILNAVRPNTLRFVPPLIITKEEASEAVSILDKSLSEITVKVG